MDAVRKLSPKRDKIVNEVIEDEDDIFNNEMISSSPVISMKSRSPIRKRSKSSKEETVKTSPEPLTKSERSERNERSENEERKKNLDSYYYSPRVQIPNLKKNPKVKETPQQIAYRLIENPNPDYDSIDDETKALCSQGLKSKYENLNRKYNGLNLNFDEAESLYKLHEDYHNVIREIYAKNNSSMYEIGYVIFLVLMEWIFVNKLGFTNFQGYAKYEWKKIAKTRTFIVEYLATEYTYGTSEDQTPDNIFWRFIKTYFISLVLFIFTHTIINKFLLMNEEFTEKLTGFIEKKFTTPVTKDLIERGYIGDTESTDDDMTSFFINQGLNKLSSNLGNKNTSSEKKKVNITF
jgi:hypothetical protein